MYTAINLKIFSFMHCVCECQPLLEDKVQMNLEFKCTRPSLQDRIHGMMGNSMNTRMWVILKTSDNVTAQARKCKHINKCRFLRFIGTTQLHHSPDIFIARASAGIQTTVCFLSQVPEITFIITTKTVFAAKHKSDLSLPLCTIQPLSSLK